MTQYTLTCINHSSRTGDFCVFQKLPSIMTMPGILFDTVWLVRPGIPGDSVTFAWTSDYGFTWSETGPLMPGVAVRANQTWPADPGGDNCIELTADGSGATAFDNASDKGTPGSLTIYQAGSVVPRQISIGIAMSGNPICAIQAVPKMTAVFTPQPSCYVTFGTFQQGQVIDLSDMLPSCQRVIFAGTQTSATVVLGANNLLSQTA